MSGSFLSTISAWKGKACGAGGCLLGRGGGVPVGSGGIFRSRGNCVPTGSLQIDQPMQGFLEEPTPVSVPFPALSRQAE